MSFAVIIHEKGGQPRRQEFDKSEVTIGRVQGNDIILPKQNVSKRHSRIVVKDGKFIIVDLKSTNGTYVNGRKIASPMVIKESDKIYIGDFILSTEPLEGAGEEAAPSKAPPPPPRPKAPSPPSAKQPAAAPKAPAPAPSKAPTRPARPSPGRPTGQRGGGARPAASAAPAPEVRPAEARSASEPVGNAATSGDLYPWIVQNAPNIGIPAPVAYQPSAAVNDDVRAKIIEAAIGALQTGSTDDKNAIASQVADEYLGVGPLGALLENANIERVYFNGPTEAWATQSGKTERIDSQFSGASAMADCAVRLLASTGFTLEPKAHFGHGYLPDGSRVHVALPSVGGPYITIDRPANNAPTLADLSNHGTLSEDMGSFLAQAFALGRVIIVASNDLEARFEVISAIASSESEASRIVFVEPGGRFSRTQGHVVLSGGPGSNLTSMVDEALQMRPDRLVLADARGAETLGALTAMGGAVNGGMIGVDAESPDDAIIRLARQVGLTSAAKASSVESMIRDRADVLVQVLAYADGRRRVTQIMDLDGEVQEVFSGFDAFAGTGYIPRWYENARSLGHELKTDIFG